MFTANSNLEIFLYRSALVNSKFYQAAYSILINGFKRIVRYNAFLDVNREEMSYVIAGKSEGHLCKVIGSEGEEV